MGGEKIKRSHKRKARRGTGRLNFGGGETSVNGKQA